MFRQHQPIPTNILVLESKPGAKKKGQILITPNSVSNVSSHVKSTSQVEECVLLLGCFPLLSY
jgi:hypothetical protein